MSTNVYIMSTIRLHLSTYCLHNSPQMSTYVYKDFGNILLEKQGQSEKLVIKLDFV